LSGGAAWEREKATWPHHELSRFIDAGGIRWHVQQAGTGPSLLLVHGTGASTHSWRDLIPALARDYSVVAADLPGHGFSGPAGRGRGSIEGMSGYLAALLRTLDFNPQYCVGHSAGAVILCRLALDRCVTPRCIISLNGAFIPLSGAAGVIFSPIARLMARGPLLPRLIAQSAGNTASVARVIAGTGSRLDAAGLDLYVRLVRRPEHVAGALTMMSNWDLSAFRRELPRLGSPLALIVGENDRTVPPEQALEVQRCVANAVVHRMRGLGHLAHEEDPAWAARAIAEIARAH
jgi:magnesium chelatase accessory protein